MRKKQGSRLPAAIPPAQLSVVKTSPDEVLLSVKRTAQSVVPGDFHWWIEIDSDINIAVRWVWLGHAAVTHLGGVTDGSIEILLALLGGVDWPAERNLSIDSVEGYERKMLTAAQGDRRRKTSGVGGTSLPPVAMPEPPPFSIEGKKRVHRAGLARAGYMVAFSEKTRREHAEIAAKDAAQRSADYAMQELLPRHALTKDSKGMVGTWVWEEFPNHYALLDGLISRPAETYKHIVTYGILMDNPEHWRKAWLQSPNKGCGNLNWV